MNLSAADKKMLLQMARASIEAHLLDKPVPTLKDAPPVLGEPGGSLCRCTAGGNSGAASAIWRRSNPWGNGAGDGRVRGLS